MVTSTPIPPLPQAPSRSDGPAAFNLYADPFIAAMPPMVVQINIRLDWIATQVNAAEGYAITASQAATAAGDSAEAAGVSLAATQALAAALGDDAGLPSLIGNARRALGVLANEQGVSFQTQIKLISIEPLSVVSAGGAISLDIGANGVFNLTLTAAATISFANRPTLSATESMVILVRVTQSATAYSLTWPSGIVWVAPGGVAPATPNAGKRAEFILTIEGATIYGRKGASN